MEEKGKGTWSLDIRSGKLVWDSITKKIHEVSEDFVPILEEEYSFIVKITEELLPKMFNQFWIQAKRGTRSPALLQQRVIMFGFDP